MKSTQKNNFPKIVTTSLTKENPYFSKQGYYLPYHYNDPSFSNNYKGLFLKKDIYIQTLLHKRYVPNKNIKYIKYTKKNNSSYPNEIFINTNLPPRENRNIFQYYLLKTDRKILEENPYIVKYGSFSFGQQTIKPKINLTHDKINTNSLNIDNKKNNNNKKGNFPSLKNSNKNKEITQEKVKYTLLKYSLMK